MTILDDRHPEESVRAQVGQLDGIEAMRAIAVTWVVAFHYLLVRDARAADPWNAWILDTPPASVVVRNGPLGVELFFIITGFLLALPWVRSAFEDAPPPRARDFYVRRVRRIVPAYYVHLALLFAFFLPLLQGIHHAWETRGLVAYNAIAHATFLHYTTPLSSASLSLNGALWSLTLEAQFYLLLPLLAPRFARSPLAWALGLFAAAAAWRWLALNDLQPLVEMQMALGSRWQVPEAAIRHLLYTQLPGYLGHFAAGMGIAMAWWRWRARGIAPRHGPSWPLAVVAAAAVMYWAYGMGGGGRIGALGFWLVSIAGLSVLLLACVRGAMPLARWLRARPLQLVGHASYSIYLYHLPILLLWNHFRVLDGSAWSAPLYLAAVLGSGWLSYAQVERRFLHAAPPARHL